MKISIYRGQSDKVEAFSVYEGKGDTDTMSENGPGIYFMDFKHRARALPYALFNHKSLFDDEEEETLSSGFFYECEIEQSNEKFLSDIPASELKEYVEDMLDHIFDNNYFKYEFLLEEYPSCGKDDEKAYDYFVSDILAQDSVYDAILDIHRTIAPDSNAEFVKSLLPTLEKLGSFIAKHKDAQEIIVYDPDRIQIVKAIEVYKEQLEATKEERFALARELS